MYILFGLLFAFLFVASLVMPWTNLGRIKALEEQVRELRKQLGLARTAEFERMEKEVAADQSVQATPPFPLPTIPTAVQVPPPPPPPPSRRRTSESSLQKPRLSFEQQFGARLPVWVGGIALALAGFYLVKYSIEVGLLNEQVRVTLGVLFGAGLLQAASWLRKRPEIANGPRIAQTLAGAGIADLYVSIFAASSLYHLVPIWLGFIGMAGVTFAAVALSLRHGAPIALLGLIGGFLTPALMQSHEPNAALLFMYLYFVVAGLFAVIRRQAWWWMAVPLVLAAFAWVGIWMLANTYHPLDTLWLGFFLLALSMTFVAASNHAAERGEIEISWMKRMAGGLNYLTLGGAVVMMGTVAMNADFGFMAWALFSLLAAGGLGLSFFNHKLYGFVPFVSMAVNAVMLMLWRAESPDAYLLTAFVFAMLYAGGGYVLMWRSEKPVHYAALSGLSAIGYYLIAYFALHGLPHEAALQAPLPGWSGVAVLLALLATAVVRQVLLSYQGRTQDGQWMMAIFASAATAFLAIGLTVGLPREFLSVAMAAELLAVAWIGTKLPIRALRSLVAALGVAFAVVLIPQILLLIQLTAYSLTETQLMLQRSVPVVDWPLFQLGLPAAAFIGASVLLRRQKDDTLVAALEAASVTLIGVMGYYLARHGFHPGQNVLFIKAGLIERASITNVLFAFAMACMWAGRHYLRRAVWAAGLVIGGIALFRTAFFELLAYNPLWSRVAVGEMPFVNALALSYGLPAAWMTLAAKQLRAARWNGIAQTAGAAALALLFMFISLNVRQFYQGAYLNGNDTSNAEIYTYSVAWLLTGIGLLAWGTRRNDRAVRIASLLVMILSVGKVFLYDASELTGLFRVFSFLGLGLSLIGLSWFYSRFVFNGINKEKTTQ